MLFLRSSIQFFFAAAALGLTGACSGALDSNLNGSGDAGADDSGGHGGTGSDAASHGDGSTRGGGPCATNSDCGTGKMCAFKVATACGASGTCVPAPAPNTAECTAYSAGCACDGSVVNLVCSGYPAGYASRPIRHTGNCATTFDAAATSCTTDSDCGGSNLCEFKIADACSAVGVCFTPPPPGPTCAAYSPACTCDSQTINVICTRYPSGYASQPVAHSGACDVAAVDAGSGAFACDNGTCKKGQICRIASGGASPTTASCIAVPAACASKRTCACVEADLGAQLCSETNEDITVTFQYP